MIVNSFNIHMYILQYKKKYSYNIEEYSFFVLILISKEIIIIQIRLIYY